MFLLPWWQKSRNKFFRDTFHAKTCIKISDTVVFGIPRSASRSHTVSHRSLLIAARTRSTFSGALLVAGLPERGSLPTDSWPSLKSLYNTLICTALIALSPKTFWIPWIVSTEECSSLKENLMQIHCSTRSVILNAMATQYTCSLNDIYCPHWLEQWCLIVHACAFQSTLLGCQVISMSCKVFWLY